MPKQRSAKEHQDLVGESESALRRLKAEVRTVEGRAAAAEEALDSARRGRAAVHDDLAAAAASWALERSDLERRAEAAEADAAAATADAALASGALDQARHMEAIWCERPPAPVLCIL